MAERIVQRTLNGAATTPRKRNSYSGEEKLHVIKWYGKNGKNGKNGNVCALTGLLGFLPFNAALRIPVSSEREQVYQH